MTHYHIEQQYSIESLSLLKESALQLRTPLTAELRYLREADTLYVSVAGIVETVAAGKKLAVSEQQCVSAFLEEQLQQYPSQSIVIDCPGMHPDVFYWNAFADRHLRCTLNIHYPTEDFASQVLQRRALSPLTITSDHGLRAMTRDDLFPQHPDLILLANGSVISRAMHRVVGFCPGTIVFIEPMLTSEPKILDAPLPLPAAEAPEFLPGIFSSGLPCALRNVSILGKPRYDFTALYEGAFEKTHLLTRVPPGIVAHHKSGRSFPIEAPELLFLPEDRYHVTSLTLHPDGRPHSWYVNINNAIEVGNGQFTWEDWELDLKVLCGKDNRFYPMLLDLDEFIDAQLPECVRSESIAEIERCIHDIYAQVFPFHHDYLQHDSIQRVIAALCK